MQRRSHHGSIVDHAPAPAPASSTSAAASSSAMMLDPSSDMDARRRLAMEMHARAQHQLAAAEDSRARAAALTDPSAAQPVLTPPRLRSENTYKEAEYDAEITRYMVDMDVS